MKKVIFAVLFILLCGSFLSYAAELKVGDKVGDFKLSAALNDNNTVSVHRNSRAKLFISYMPARARQMIMIMYLRHWKPTKMSSV
jgi:hypothetical protein